MLRSNLLLTALLSLSLAACGGKKDDDKKAAAETPDPSRQPPTATGPAQGGGALGMLFGADKPAAGKPSTGGLFGGGLNLGELGKAADATGTAPAPDKAPPAADRKPADGGPSCADVAKRAATVAKADLAGADPALAAQIEPLLTEMCTSMQWSAAARQCVMDARDEAGLEKCNALLPDEGGGGMAGADDDEEGDMGDLPAMPKADKPVSSGNAACDAMAANVVTLMMASAGQQVASERYGIQNALALACATIPWPQEAVQCLTQARSDQDAEACAARYDLGG